MKIDFKNTILDFVLTTGFMISFRDIYKLLYQSFHGPEHAVIDVETATKWFWEEWELLKLPVHASGFPIFQILTIDGITPTLYRVKMSPDRTLGLNPESLLDEFIRSANEFPRFYPIPDISLHERFVEAWDVIGYASENNYFEFLEHDEYENFTGEMKKNDWPIVSHSKKYRNLLNPHYRLIMDIKKVLPGAKV